MASAARCSSFGVIAERNSGRQMALGIRDWDAEPWINEAWYALPAAFLLLFGALPLVFAIATHQRFLDADVVEERERPSRVLAKDCVAGGQRLAHARGKVAEVSDRGCA